MPWFKVDDTLAWHSKTVQAGNAAIGLWARAGSWSMQQLTDGFVPATIAQSLGSKAEIDRLVAAGLWIPAVRDEQTGWEFHEWLERQPSREQVEADRAATRARQQRARDAAKAKREAKQAKGDQGPDHSNITSLSRRDARRDARRDTTR